MISDILKPKSDKEIQESIERMINYMPSLIEFLKDYELTHERNVNTFDYLAKGIGESMSNLYIVDGENDFYKALNNNIQRIHINKVTERVSFTSRVPFNHALIYKGIAAKIRGPYQIKLLISKESMFKVLSNTY